MSEKIAVVGYSCRLPGGRFSELWARLCDGEDLVTEIPPDRWAVETYSHPSKSQPGTAYTARAGTIGDVSGFDAAFFG
ncbi:MAG: beta-ketoacyl synthase N-terminal-like domain-containing protein, partial [Sedimenticolaceae bacterium]